MSNQLIVQAVLAVGSWLGIAVGWLPGHRGHRRIRGPLGAVIANVGPVIMVGPWIAMPFLAQPYFVGSVRTGTLIAGIVLLAAAAAVIVWGTPFIFRAAKKGGDELDPEFLVVKGPYKWMRHVQYTAAVTALLGLALLKGGLYTLLLIPICYLLFRFEAYLEESQVLEPKFGDEFRQFKKRVPGAFFGVVGTVILTAAYLAFVALLWLGKLTLGS